LKLFSAIEKLLPEHMETLFRRHEILKVIRSLQPVGRRSLTSKLHVTERVLRKDVDAMKEQGLITTASSGMSITENGLLAFTSFEEIVKEQSGIFGLEKKIKDKLNVSEVKIVEGNSDEDKDVKHRLGLVAANTLLASLKSENIIAVTGGTTLGSVSQMLKPDPKAREMVFVPARGGLGERVEYEANTICSKMGNVTNSEYHMLHVPEEVSNQTYDMLINERHVKEILSLIKSSTIVVHGIGDAKIMASRRKTSKDVVLKLEEERAVGEAFGYYFDKQGNVIHRINTIGLQLSDLNENKKIITVAGGSSKAAAIQAYIKMGYTDVLIIDEGAAKKLLSLN
jgi:central glycolytic genes regulator